MHVERLWEDRFEGPAGRAPDPSGWAHDLGSGGWGCGQRQEYTDAPANAALTGTGGLAITARRESDGRITSARVTTKDRVTARYGRFEARIKVPSERGSWPAFWLLGQDLDEVGWPACGEIDVMEQVGIDPTRVHGTLHGPGYCGLSGGIGRAYDHGRALSADFHRCAVVWSPDSIEWLLDDRPYQRLTPADVGGAWPFDHDVFVLLNLAVGGDWPGNSAVTPELPSTMIIDWVRVSAAAR